MYGNETFGAVVAQRFFEQILELVEALKCNYLSHPECRHLPTDDKRYRNIIVGSYLIIYRITNKRIEVLEILSSFRSITKIKSVRSISPHSV